MYLAVSPNGDIKQISEDEIDSVSDEYVIVKQIKSCKCESCNVVPYNRVIEIPVGRCEGKCDDTPYSNTCIAGIDDSFSLSNGAEPSSPSSALITNLLSTCSAGIQSGFDIFANDRCFGHTFTNCFINNKCPLKSAKLDICLQAAQVPLTNTDSLILGVNGGGLWSKRLPDLNGGTWNPGDVLCLTLDLNNLPIDGASIMNTLGLVGHLDVVVQDDTSVDYLKLNIEYSRCQRCLPVSTTINSLYQGNRVTDFTSINKCDCLDLTSCHRESLFETHFEGSAYEKVIDVGQCIGRCPNFARRCVPEEYSIEEIGGPFGSKTIKKIKSCKCSKLQWNVNGLLD